MSTFNFKSLYLLGIIILFSAISYSAPNGSVTLNMPPDGTKNIRTPVFLVWTAPTATDFYLYTIQVATDTSFQSPLINENTTTTSYPVSRNLTPNKMYYWHVIAQQKLSLNEPTIAYYISNPWVFYTASSLSPTPVALPTTPTLLSPINNQTTTPLSAKLNWSSTARATSYSLQVSINAQFSISSIKINKDNLLNTTYETGYVNGTLETVLKPGTRYYWRVQAANIFGISAYTTGQFTTRNTTEPPTLLTPVNDSTTGIDSVVFSWKAINGVTSYQYELSSNSNFDNILLTQTINAPSTSTTITNPPVTLVKSNRYYWRVFGQTNAGLGQVSPVWSFTIQSDYSPANDAVDQLIKPVLSWPIPPAPVNAQISYQIQLSTDPGFNYVLFSKTALPANNITVAAENNSAILGYSTTYYWHIKSTLNGITSSWSFPYRFTTIASPVAAPGTVTLLTPTDGTQNVDIENALTFTWTPGLNAASYTLQLSTSKNFSTITLGQTEIATESYTLTPAQYGLLFSNVTYYWRVRTENSSDSSTSSTYSFNTKPMSVITLVRPLLTSPIDNYSRGPGTVTFSYYPVSGATKYNLVIATSPDFNINSIISNITTANLTSNYSFNTQCAYYWRVKAIRDLDTSDGMIDGESEFTIYRTLIIQ